jgi:dTDP-4-amino-4,6-dideoxygalactose transaminase
MKEEEKNISFLDLKAQYKDIQDEINQKISAVLSSQRFILGPEVEELEKEIASYSEVKFAVGVSSGSDALIISQMALGVGEGHEVITTPFTFFATAGSVVRLGARPLFCDVEEGSFNLSPLRLEELLRRKIEEEGKATIKAIIPVHLFGQCADMDPILTLAKKYELRVIEDAAQAVGAEYLTENGIKKAGSMGDLGILSFFPSKNLGAYGDGGMVLTNDEELADKLKVLRVHGSKDKYYYKILGGNFRLDALQAAVLRVKLKHLESWHEKRRENAVYYSRKFKEVGLLEEGFVELPAPQYINKGAKNFHVYNQYVIRAKERDELQRYLKGRNVPTVIYYPLSLHLQQCFSYLGYREGDFPESEKASREVLALPIYPELDQEQQDFIVSCIHDFYSK